MPALVCCKIRWNVADDDFVPSSLLSGVLRFIMLILAIALNLFVFGQINHIHDDRYECKINETCGKWGLFLFFAFGIIVFHFGMIGLDVLQLVVSASGTLQYSKKRTQRVQILIILKLFSLFPELAFSIIGMIIAWNPNLDLPFTTIPEVAKFIGGYSVLLLVSIIFKITYHLIFIDPCGCCTIGRVGSIKLSLDHNAKEASQQEQPPGTEETDAPSNRRHSVEFRRSGTMHFKSNRTTIRNYPLFNTATFDLWWKRFNKLTKAPTTRHGPSYEVAKLFGIFFQETDYVVSDLATALLLVGREQRSLIEQGKPQNRACRKKLISQMTDNQFEGGTASYKYEPPREWNPSNPDDLHELSEAIYYYNYAMGIYGWPLYVFDSPCKGLCKLACKASLLCCTEGRKLCCNCSRAAFHIQVPNCGTKDVIHCSKQNECFKSPYYIILDHKKKALVITIRGTLSIEDVVTSLSVALFHLPFTQPPLDRLSTYVHKGWYETAQNIYHELEKEERLNIFNDQRYQSYRLVIVGHSLGGAVASILALLIRKNKEEHRRRLRCFGYSTPGCVFSYPLAVYTRSFITTVVPENDILPRMNWRSLLFLKKSMTRQLEKCQKPKYQVLYADSILCQRKSSTKRENSTGEELMSVEQFLKQVYDHPDWNELGDYAPKPLDIDLKTVMHVATAAVRWKSRALGMPLLRKHTYEAIEKQAKDVVTIPAFVPGRVLQIDRDTETSSKSWCTWFRKTRYKLTWHSNEDYCLMELQGGKPFVSHLPRSLKNIFMVLKKEHLANEMDEELLPFNLAFQLGNEPEDVV